MSDTLQKTPLVKPPVPPRPDRKVLDGWVEKKMGISIGMRGGSGVSTTPPSRPPPPVPPRTMVPPPVPPRTKVPPPVPPRPPRQAVAQTAAQVMQATAPALLAGLPDSEEATEIRTLLAEHAKLVPSEAKVFAGTETLDDLVQVHDPDERQRKLGEMQAVLAAVSARREGLRAALKSFPAPQPEEVSKAISAGWQCVQNVADHLPTEFQRMDGAMAAKRLDTLMMTPDEKAGILAEAKSGFKDDDGNDISASLGDTFRNVVEPVSTKSFERQSFYFDQFVASPPQDQIKQVMEVTDRVMEQGQRILDAGGKLRDVEELMAKTGIPKDWWPPKLVDTLQAWRKVEREMAKERVSAMFAKKESEGVDMTSITGFTDFFCSTVPDKADALQKLMGDPAVTKPINDMMQNLSHGYGLGAVGLTALQTLNFDELPKNDAQKLRDGIENSLSLIASGVDTAVSALNVASSAGATIISTVVPGLSLVSAGIKLGLAVKKLGEHTALRVQTGMMKSDAIKALGNASMEDGGAFLNALDNEVGGRNKQITQDGVEVFAASTDLAGSAAGSFGGHYGLAAQGALKIVSTGVTLGSKFIFTNVNWGEARKAKALLTEAQAGNPVARMEIFKNSNLYAKMYVCVLCKEGNPLAKTFVYQRGIEEDDLDGAMSLKILREALLKSADQSDENDIEDNWLLENAGSAGKALVAVGNKVAGLGEALNDVRKNRKIAYNANWLPSGPAEITSGSWEKVKADAIAAGLYDEETGIGTALGDAAKRLAEADTTLKAIATGTTYSVTTQEGQTAQALLLKTVASLDAAYGSIIACTPISNPTGKPPKAEMHKGMSVYLGQLAEAVGKKRTEIDKALRDSGLKNTGWQPGIGSDALDPAAWGVNWAAGVKQACLPEGDAGLGGELEATARAKQAYESADPKKKREKALAYSEALNDLVSAGKDCLGQTGEVPGMAAYVQTIIAKAADNRRTLDRALGGVDWKPDVTGITAESWQTLWEKGVAGGYLSGAAKDGGVLIALQDMATLKKAVDDAKDGKPKLKARMEYALATGKMLLAEGAFLTAQRDVADAVKKFLAGAKQQAFDQQAAFDEARTKVAFTATPGLTVAGWEATYGDAVAKGALPEAKSAAKAMSKELKAYLSKVETLKKAVTEKKFKDALKQAPAVKAQIEALLAVIDSKLMVADGYAAHPTMKDYLAAQREAIKKELESPVLKTVLAGDVAGDQFKGGVFTFETGDFSKIKESAISNGVIPDAKTGMQAALKARAKSDAALTKARTARPPAPEALKKALEQAKADAAVLRTVAGKLRGLSSNRAWSDYAESAVQKVADYVATLT